MVDPERVGVRLDRLRNLLEHLERTRARGEEEYLANEELRRATERRLQLAIQTCIDIGAQLAAELNVEPPADYAAVFTNLARAGHLEGALAERLAEAARQRNVLVHLYLEVDDSKVFAALGRLDDLREFAAAAQRLADAGVS